ncbi:MAG: hypothetical protein ACREBS_03415 [Nitrososphaerales archaeon]
MPQTLGIDNVLSGVRAVLAKELMGRGYSQKDISQVLGTSPAAVTLYSKDRRGKELSKMIRADKNAKLVIDNLMEQMTLTNKSGNATAEGLSKDTFPMILDAAYRIMRLVSSPEKAASSATGASKSVSSSAAKDSDTLAQTLLNRLEEEQLAAQRNMALAVGTTDEVARTIFRQIASDSIRHAEIVSFLLSQPKNDSKRGPNRKKMVEEEIAQIEAMIRGEESATEEPIKPGGIDPSFRLLLESMDIDEEKHKKLLKGLLAINTMK